MSESFPKRYDYKTIEPKWQQKWEASGIYRFNREDKSKPTYSINTPPPYPSGEFHVGNALNHTYIDFVARYKRMRGYNVLFPQGWDCHGLPTEVRVEKTIGKSKSEVPPEEFLRLTREYTLKWIEPMKKAIKALGCSIDWTTEYRTMEPDYWRRTQLSFVLMYKKGLIYKSKHPVNWCPRCETAIAEAEVEYVEKNRPLYYFNFQLEDGSPLTIASTRPELLAACVAVAVNPEDHRYKHLIGKRAKVALYDRWVSIIADEEVDPEFGTGAVMICTYGDKTDVRWQARHGLPVIEAIDERGRMKEVAGPLAGLKVEEARRKAAELLKEKGLLVKVESIKSNIGTCWRCHTPIEIIPREQWFVKTKELADKVLEEAKKIQWVPPHAYNRLEAWVKSLDWDWPISRQRLFATPIPVWYCQNCGHIIVAEPDWLPIDPRKDPPKIGRCPKCGSTSLKGETAVMDTWMDSSITAAVHAGWPDNMDPRLFPADLQPNGYDIIRTWDYYLLVRGIALFGKTQYKTALINGMVLGKTPDGEIKMMHKSLGNYVPLLEVLEKYGADAFRLWVATAAATGSDILFTWEALQYTKRFLTKLWNMARYVNMILEGEEVPEEVEESELRLMDKWILNELEKLTATVTAAMEKFDFKTAASSIIDFAWHKFADHYIEATKYRTRSGVDKKAALYTLNKVLYRIVHMISVFAPHIAEEIYHRMFKEKAGYESITTAPWPRAAEYDEKVIEKGAVVIETIAAGRRAKHDAGIALGKEISEITVYCGDEHRKIIETSIEDIKGTLRAKKVTIKPLNQAPKDAHPAEKYPEIKVKIAP